MQRARPPLDKWHNVVFFLVASLTVAVDQLSKTWISGLLPVGSSWAGTGFFRLTHIHNTGGVFGLFQGYSLALTIVACVGVAVILVYALFVYRRFPVTDGLLGMVALGLVLGGTMGNLIDRVRQGYVVDFIDFGFWPAFNVADSAVVVGVIIFAYSLLTLVSTEKG